MKISKKQLIEMGACQDVLSRFIEQTGNTDEPVGVLSLIGGKNITSDLIWLAGETLPKEKVARFACDVALINIEKIKPHTDKYDLIVDFLTNPTADTTDAAITAATNAAAYARAAADAAAVADYAARAVAVDAFAAFAARAVAVDALAAGATQEQINQLLVKLFEG